MKALSFGEILFDCFPSYERIGGAPFNSSAHMASLGGEASVISALGDDDLGKRALEELRRFNVSSRFVRISGFPTGRADITLSEGGNADYTFNSPCAWDDIRLSPEELSEIEKENYDVFIFGTLASRSGTTRNTLESLLGKVRARHFFFDVNFRKEFYSREMILNALRYTTILKVNEDELPIMLGFAECGTVEELIVKFDLEYVLLTLGENGSTLYTRTKAIHKGIVPGKVVDTVGAGDSLSAAFLYFLSRDGEEETALEKAGAVASFVVSSEGAVPEYPESLRKSLSV